jgi:proteasome assembly chaperone (PAC2) family protein
MPEALNLWKKPQAKENYLIVGWRQWADAGSVSSGLPGYLVELLDAQPIGVINPDGFYLFQFPGTHDLVRPVVHFEEGYPKSLETPHNDLFYSGDDQLGVIILLGDEPHMDIERYVATLLNLAKDYNVKRIVGLGGVYGELPYDKERMISTNYSLPRLKQEVSQLAVNLSDYQGGASIGSYVCRRAGDQDIEYVGLYALVPAYDISPIAHIGSSLRLESDYLAWLGVLRRIKYMLKLNLDLSDLEKKSRQLVKMMDEKIEEIEREAPQLKLREKLEEISAGFKETPFIPLDDVWEDELRRLMEKFDDDEPPEAPEEE